MDHFKWYSNGHVQVCRCICLLNHPIANTYRAHSTQIVIPGRQVGRANNIYITSVGHRHSVTAKDWYIVTISTVVETGQIDELQPAFAILGDIEDKLVFFSHLYEPLDSGVKSQLFLSKSLDVTSHCGTMFDDALDIIRRGETTSEQVPLIRPGKLDLNVDGNMILKTSSR